MPTQPSGSLTTGAQVDCHRIGVPRVTTHRVMDTYLADDRAVLPRHCRRLCYISWKILLMGGSGSSRWSGHTKAPTVEMSFVLDVGAFTGPRHDLVDSGVVDLRGKLFAHPLRASFFIDLVVVPGMLYLSTEFLGRSVTAEIELASEPRHFGGRQVYFRCPGQACGRRAVKLYLPLYRPLASPVVGVMGSPTRRRNRRAHSRACCVVHH